MMKAKWVLILGMILCFAVGLFASPAAEQEETVELSLYMPPPTADLSDKEVVLAEVNKMLEAKIGATIDITFVGWGDYAAKINTMLAANEPFDWYSGLGTGGFTANIARGTLFPLDDLLEEYGQTILEMTPPDLWPAVTFEGHKMAIINILPYAQTKGIDFNQELVEKYEFDYLNVETLRDIEPFLAQIKAGEPDMYPALWGNNMAPLELTRFDEIIGPIVYDAAQNMVVNMYDTPLMRERMEIFHDWYNKGYFPKDAARLGVDEVQQINTGRYAVWGANVAMNGPSEKESNTFGVPTVSVVTNLELIRTNAVNGVVGYISKTSQNKEKTMQFLDTLWSDKLIFNTLAYGVEGRNYEVISGAGTDMPTVQTIDPMRWALWHPWIAEMMDNQWPSNWNDAAALEEFRYNNDNSPRSPILGFVFDPTPVQDEVGQLSAIDETVRPTVVYSGAFPGTVDAYLADLQSQFDSVGYDKVFAEVERQLAEWRSSNN